MYNYAKPAQSSPRRRLRTPPLTVAALLSILAISSVRAEEREMHASLAGQLKLFQVRIVSGRIVASGPASQQNLTSNYMGSRRRERLTIDLGGGRPSVNYERTTSDERLVYEINQGNQVTIQLVPRSSTERATLVFNQPAEGPLTLTVATGEQTKAYRAPSLWHLLLTEPAIAHDQLLPLIELLRPKWRLAAQAREIEKALCQEKQAVNGADHAAWEQYVRQLSSDRFIERERAEQQLAACGPIVLPFLRTQERADLDAEQKFRIRRVLRGMVKDVDEDTPDRVVPWLSGDPVVWFAFLAHHDQSVRQLAADRLAKVLGMPIEFDAAASDEKRAEQINELRTRYGSVLETPAPADAKSNE